MLATNTTTKAYGHNDFYHSQRCQNVVAVLSEMLSGALLNNVEKLNAYLRPHPKRFVPELDKFHLLLGGIFDQLKEPDTSRQIGVTAAGVNLELERKDDDVVIVAGAEKSVCTGTSFEKIKIYLAEIIIRFPELFPNEHLAALKLIMSRAADCSRDSVKIAVLAVLNDGNYCKEPDLMRDTINFVLPRVLELDSGTLPRLLRAAIGHAGDCENRPTAAAAETILNNPHLYRPESRKCALLHVIYHPNEYNNETLNTAISQVLEQWDDYAKGLVSLSFVYAALDSRQKP